MLPEPPTQDLSESIAYYSVRLTGFIIRTRVTATLSREQLETVSRFLPDLLTRRWDNGTPTIAALYAVQEQVRIALRPFEELDMLATVRARHATNVDVEGGSKVPAVPIEPIKPSSVGEDLF